MRRTSIQISTIQDSQLPMYVLGHDVNLIWAILLFFTAFMLVFGGLVNYLEAFLPPIITQAFKYGKTATQSTHGIIKAIQLPKAYFLHFYVFAVIYIPALLYISVSVYLLESPAPKWLMSGLDFCCTAQRISGTGAESVLLVMVLLSLQCVRRLYECLFVNVDTGSKMNVLHYIVGFAHYFCAGTGVLCESPGFVSPFDLHHTIKDVQWLHVEPKLRNVAWYQWGAVIIFLWAWKHQFVAHKIFAQLKKSNKKSHSIPYGDWFGSVSCPHYLAEIIMYLCFVVILGPKHWTGIVIFVWVLINQVVAALMSHYWYRENFHLYPAKRKAIFPLVL